MKEVILFYYETLFYNNCQVNVTEKCLVTNVMYVGNVIKPLKNITTNI
jgi:hypothetical protein